MFITQRTAVEKISIVGYSKILNHDTTPTIPASCKPSESSIYSSDILTSKGENPSTEISSEGGDNTDTFFQSLDDRIKRKSHLTPQLYLNYSQAYIHQKYIHHRFQ